MLIIFYSTLAFGQSGVKGYYRFNGNSTDVGTNALNGTDSNVTYTTTGGKIHGAAIFNGTTSYIQVANSATPYNWGLSQNFTITGWMKITKTGEQYVISKTTGTPYPFDVRAFTSDHSIAMFRNNTSTSKDIYSAWVDAKWSFFAFVKSGSTLTAYVTGYPGYSTNTDLSSGTVTNAINLYFGRRSNSSNLSFGGLLSDIIFEDRAWSPAQLKNKQSADLGFF